MEKRILGGTDLAIAPIAFGGNVFGWTIDQQQSFSILDQFINDGFNFIDTANSYSHWKPGNKGGESETIIGSWLASRGKRNDIIIATKVGSDAGTGTGKSLKRNHIVNEVEQSLQRLKTDYIDLYFSHYDDETITVEEPLRAYEALIKAGKVRWIGASNFSAPRLREALVSAKANNLPQYQVYQPGYNLVDRAEFETAHQQICLDFNLGVVPYYSLASGFLSGKYKSTADLKKSERGAGMDKYFNDRSSRILAALEDVAGSLHTTPAAVALAWLLQQPTVTAPIASVTNLEQLKSFSTAAQLVLSTAALSQLNEASRY
jgi:aryl-alcohol dehydrogenase-like predicted oxidoreductase